MCDYDDDELSVDCTSALDDRDPPMTNSGDVSTCEPTELHPPNDQVSKSDEDDDELSVCCSSAIDDCIPPMTNSGDISTCEPIELRSPSDQVSPHVEIFDEPLPLLADEVKDFTTPADNESHSRDETDGLKAVDVDPLSSDDHQNAEVSCSSSFPHSVDFHSNLKKRVSSDRRCSRRRKKMYDGKPRRHSARPSSIYRLSLPHQTTAALWQPWHDDHCSSATVQQGSSLQWALENLGCLTSVSNTSVLYGASASDTMTSATGNVTSFVSQMTSSALPIGN